MTLTDFLTIVTTHDLRDTFDDPLTADDYPAFEIAVEFLSRFVDAQAQAMLFRVTVSNLSTIGAVHTFTQVSKATALNSDHLSTRTERFARMTGRQIDITYPVMAAAIIHLELAGADFGAGRISTFIRGEEVKDALDDLKASRAIMNAAPAPIVDEPRVLAILALHGIDAPANVIRLALAQRPDRIVAVVREPGSHWMRSVPLLTRPWSVKLGLEHLLDEFGGK